MKKFDGGSLIDLAAISSPFSLQIMHPTLDDLGFP